jgi:hypothetical protein
LPSRLRGAFFAKPTAGFRRLGFVFLLFPVFWILPSVFEASKTGSWFRRRKGENRDVKTRQLKID